MTIFSLMSVGWGQDNDINKFSLIDTSLLKYKSLDLHTLLIDGIDYEKFEKLLIQQERNNYQSTLTYSENFNWVDENWFERRRTTYTINEDFYIIEKNIEEFVDGFWVNYKKEIYNYENSYNSIEIISQLWDENMYINDSRYLTIYDQNNNILERYNQDWESYEWVSYYELFNIYDSNNNLIETIEYEQEFQNISKDTYLYDFNNNEIEHISQYSGDGYNWVYDSKTSKTYDDNNLIEIVVQWWSEYELEWINDYKEIMIFDNDNLVEKLKLIFFEEEWVNDYKEIMTFDNYNLVEKLKLIFLEEEWVNDNLITYTYNPYNQKVFEQIYVWNDLEWELSCIYQWTYQSVYNQNVSIYSQYIKFEEESDGDLFKIFQMEFEFDQNDFVSQSTFYYYYPEEWGIDDYSLRLIYVNDELGNYVTYINQTSDDQINWTNQNMINYHYLYYCNDDEVFLWGECYNIEETTYINLESSGLTGEIPSELRNLINLTFLNLSRNELTGEIPIEIGNLINLTNLDLYNNQLTGEIPSSLGDLVNLNNLILSDNELTGEIPPEIWNLSNLDELYLYKNNLTGEIPLEIGNLSNLTKLYLSENLLNGHIPLLICNLPLSEIYLTDNHFCPPYPECLVEEFFDTGLDGCFSINEDGFGGCTIEDLSPYNGETNPDPNGDNYDFVINPNGTEVNGQYDLGESFYDINSNNLYDNMIGYQNTEECVEYQLGDLNEDGSLDVLDIIVLIDCILFDGGCNDSFDIVSDGIFNVVDVIGLVNMILDI